MIRVLILVVSIFVFSGCTKKHEDLSQPKSSGVGAMHEDPNGYYTCAMHPQVHEHSPGKCPICGMSLTKTRTEPSSKSKTGKISAPVTMEQLELAGIKKYTVKRKDLKFTIPVSGRLLSGREVSFQLYESDLKLVRPGFDFSGSTASSSEEVLRGKIRQVDSILDPSSRTVRVIGVLNEIPKRVLVDGSFHGEITSLVKNQISVPEDAILHSGSGDFVYLFSRANKNSLESILTRVPVVIGNRSGHEIQIVSGLDEENVISAGPNFLIDSEAKIRGSSDQANH